MAERSAALGQRTKTPTKALKGRRILRPAMPQSLVRNLIRLVYIENQPEHHRRKSFQDELRALLKRHGIDYDERYLWD